MGHKHHPRRGSLQYWPHNRSSKHAPRIRSWAKGSEKKLLGFIGYKVGMTHVLMKQTNTNSHRKNMEIFTPVTVVECPPLKVYSVRYYTIDEDQALKLTGEVFSKKMDKELVRKTNVSKKEGKTSEAYDEVRVVVYTQPKLTTIGKKKPDMLEICIGGSLSEAGAYANSLLDKEIKISEVFKNNQFIDVHGVTKGKGFCGVTKRVHPKRLQHKSEKGVRGIGTLGSWHPNRVLYTVAQAGKWGYHLRTEFNKLSVKVGNDPKEINPKGGFISYGEVRSDFILVKGSIPGATKRPIAITEARRATKKLYPINISYTSLESKQR
ncbi:50S ribosomal protein L3 [Candidatus Woesearchaeota archaeon]|nr:50S ribosomal protein L3 [Candidatus Woesearchaeota archaeon]